MRGIALSVHSFVFVSADEFARFVPLQLSATMRLIRPSTVFAESTMPGAASQQVPSPVRSTSLQVRSFIHSTVSRPFHLRLTLFSPFIQRIAGGIGAQRLQSWNDSGRSTSVQELYLSLMFLILSTSHARALNVRRSWTLSTSTHLSRGHSAPA